MKFSQITDIVIAGTAVALALYNCAAGICSGGEATISARLQYYATQHPIVPFVAGALCGHWFWPVFGVRR